MTAVVWYVRGSADVSQQYSLPICRRRSVAIQLTTLLTGSYRGISHSVLSSATLAPAVGGLLRQDADTLRAVAGAATDGAGFLHSLFWVIALLLACLVAAKAFRQMAINTGEQKWNHAATLADALGLADIAGFGLHTVATYIRVMVHMIGGI